MSKQLNARHRLVALARLVALCALAALAAPGTPSADDTAVFSTSVPPNVLLVIDNSGSMNEIITHPAYVAGGPFAYPLCNDTYVNSDQTVTSNTTPASSGVDGPGCVRTSRVVYHDSNLTALGNATRWPSAYLKWYFSQNASAYIADINSDTNGTYSGCFATGTFAKYKRSRLSAAKDVLREVICQVNKVGAVRFGIAQFMTTSDPNGGYVRVPIDFWSTTQDAALNAGITAVDADAWTPLAETLFKSYTYFMSRDTTKLPRGKDGVTQFPRYCYSTSTASGGGAYDSTCTASTTPPDPLDCNQTTSGSQPCSCQKNFVIVITDGEPTKDDFVSASPSNTAQGFGNFVSKLIGDYNPDNTSPEAGTENQGGGIAYYLDDVAKFMHEKDFRPDLPGDQTLDVYTVGFTTNATANALLQKTATVGGGTFYSSNNAEDLADHITAAVSDIVRKSQSFTAATVPASRTADGGNFYVTEFVPSNNDPFWQGHLKNFQITVDGHVLDANGDCAVNDPSGKCESGLILPTAVPYWDAATSMPDPSARSLYTTISGVAGRFDAATVTAASLGVSTTAPPYGSYPGSLAGTAAGGSTAAAKAEYLTDEIVAYVRGCSFGTGVSTACAPRSQRLGDIFHSNPVIVGRPSAYLNEDSWKAFASTWATRNRMIYAGANDGFLHAFNAGTWDASATPPAYTRGTGQETFGFMPWTARTNIRQLPIDTGGRDYYFVDGSPKVADVWFAPASNAVSKAADGHEWHTILVGGLRQGGRSYYALDVTDPSAMGAGKVLWEFPSESGADNATYMPYMGETWSEPVITKVRVEASAGDNNGGQGYERWVVIVGAGYDPKGDPNSPTATYDATNVATTSKAGRAIFMLDARTGKVIAEKKFDYAGGSDPQAQMRFAIASAPGVFDVDSDGYADVILIGDLGGNLWKWTIHDVGADTNGDGKIDNWKFRKFFDAPEYPSSAAPTHWKSFFFPPNATLVSGTLWLGLGSGERANLRWLGIPDSSDPTELENNRFYAMTDVDPLDQSATVPAALLESDLRDATGDESCVSNTPPKRGYFFKVGSGDFNGDGVQDEGEKFVTNTALFAGYLFASTFIPTGAAGDPCVSGGTSVLYVFKIDCGKGYFDKDGDGVGTRRLDLGTGMPTDPRISISGGDAGGGGPPSCDGGTHANKVFVITSDNKIQNECTPPMSGGGTRTHYWRQRP